MSGRFQELDWRATPMGELVLRRRWDLAFDKEVHEIKLDDEFLMSSLFTVAEEELARRGLAELAATATDFDVAVGGLGLGYTALAVLANPRVRTLTVIDALAEVIDWHRKGLIPAGQTLTADPRCTLLHRDFFAALRGPDGLHPNHPQRRYHAILVDIDHSPRHLLHASHAAFYEPDGLATLARHLRPGGVFGLWSNDPPDDEFTATLAHVFDRARADTVTFPNPLQDRDATATLYLATTEGQGGDPLDG